MTLVRHDFISEEECELPVPSFSSRFPLLGEEIKSWCLTRSLVTKCASLIYKTNKPKGDDGGERATLAWSLCSFTRLRPLCREQLGSYLFHVLVQVCPVCCRRCTLCGQSVVPWFVEVKLFVSAGFPGRVQRVFPEPRRISGGHPTYTSSN